METELMLGVAQLDEPSDLVFIGNDIYVADRSNHRIRRINLDTRIITTIAGTGVAGNSGDGGLATAAQLNFPDKIDIDGAGNIYVSSNNSIRRIDRATNIISTIAGTGVSGFSGDGGLATLAQLSINQGMAIDGAGNVYIADFFNHRIRRVDAVTNIISTIAGTGVGGYNGDGKTATSTQLNLPIELEIDADGNLIIVDRGNNRIRKLDIATGIITTIAGTGVTGAAGDGGLASEAQLDAPQSIKFDARGNLFIADAGNQLIRRIDANTNIISTIAGVGTFGFSGDGTVATNARLGNPSGLAFDSKGSLYIADFGNERIRRILLCFRAPGTIPTLSQWGILILGLLILNLSLFFLKKVELIR